MKKYLCDQMCGELGRWLRAAGYDTDIVDTPLSDREVFKQAVDEGRRLITKDRDFTLIDPDGMHSVYLRSESLDEWVEQLKNEEGINWLYKPFTRCLKDNVLFEKLTRTAADLEDLPKHIKEFWICPICKEVFWLGSHTENMEKQLKSWQREH